MSHDVLDCDIAVTLVALCEFVEEFIVEDSLRTEYRILYAELALILQHHDACSRKQLGDGCHPHDMSRFHRDLEFLVCPSVAFCIHQ